MLSGLFGCMSFNDPCDTDKNNVIGYIDTPTDITPLRAQNQETALGDMLADALIQAYPQADLALLTAGTILDIKQCGIAQTVLYPGPIYLSQLNALVSPRETLVVYQLKGSELKRTLERSVSILGSYNNDQWTGFMQVGQISFFVNCTEKPYTMNELGTQIIYPGSRIEEDKIMIKNQPFSNTSDYKIITTSNTQQKKLLYLELTENKIIQKLNVSLQQAAQDYISKNDPLTLKKQSRIQIADVCKKNN